MMDLEQVNRLVAETEIWKPIHGTECKYDISSLGRVRSWNHKNGPRKIPLLMKPTITDKGYRQIHVSLNGIRKVFLIHRLVLEHFEGPCPNSSYCSAHWNGDPSDNKLSNLRWATYQEQHQDKLRHGTALFGTATANAKLNPEKVEEIKRLKRSGLTIYEIAPVFAVHPTTIARIARGVTWTWAR